MKILPNLPRIPSARPIRQRNWINLTWICHQIVIFWSQLQGTSDTDSHRNIQKYIVSVQNRIYNFGSGIIYWT